MKKFLFNNKILRERRRNLRKTQTQAEKILWQMVRNRQISGYRFFRQYSVGSYVLDFYCPKLRLAIEIDGPVHNTEEARDYDKQRTEFLDGVSIRVIRFKNEEILGNIEEVIARIGKITP